MPPLFSVTKFQQFFCLMPVLLSSGSWLSLGFLVPLNFLYLLHIHLAFTAAGNHISGDVVPATFVAQIEVQATVEHLGSIFRTFTTQQFFSGNYPDIISNDNVLRLLLHFMGYLKAFAIEILGKCQRNH